MQNYVADNVILMDTFKETADENNKVGIKIIKFIFNQIYLLIREFRDTISLVWFDGVVIAAQCTATF